MLQYAADRLGIDPKTIKDFKVQFLKTRKGKSRIGFRFNNVFVHTIEPGYVQFDAEVEYQKKKKLKPENFAVFNNVYRSDFTSAEIAAIDVQMIIWREARKKGFGNTPLPVINVVKAVKVKE